jgi:tetratricopeptide (TPR) repeat protein
MEKGTKIRILFLTLSVLAIILPSVRAQDIRKELKAARRAEKRLEWKAAELFEKVLTNPSFDKLSVRDQLEVYDALGWHFFVLEKYSKAEPLYIKAIEMRDANADNLLIKEDDRAYVSNRRIFFVESLGYLGKTQLALNKFDESRMSFQRAIKTIDNNHLTDITFLKYEYLAGWARGFYKEGRFKEALPLYEEAFLAIPSFRETHFKTAAFLTDLANVYRHFERFDKAEEFYKRAAKIMEWYESHASKGIKAFDTVAARNLQEYAFLLRKQGRIAEAEKLEVKAKTFDPILNENR